MTTSPIVSITDELLAEIAFDLELAETTSSIYATIDRDTLAALMAERAHLKQQLVAAGITAENCEVFRKDAERYQWLRDDAEIADFEMLCLTSLGEWDAYIDAARSAGKDG